MTPRITNGDANDANDATGANDANGASGASASKDREPNGSPNSRKRSGPVECSAERSEYRLSSLCLSRDLASVWQMPIVLRSPSR